MARKIAVIGTGYVGLVSGVGLADFGNYVTCVDIDRKKIENLQKGIIPIYEPGLEEFFKRNVNEKRLFFSMDIDEVIKENEVIFIAVGTPSRENGEADLSQLFSAVETISKNLNTYKVIVVKSTVPVGTTRKVKDELMKKSDFEDFDVVANPEFLREGKAVHDFFHPDRVVVGYENERARRIMEEIYRPLYLIETPFVWCNFETAELIKYASNAFLATKIAFINQIANLSEKVGADIHIVAKAMGMDGRISPKFLHPGPGFGGSCFPKDIKALVKIGENHGVDMSLVKEVIRSNENQKLLMVRKLEKLVGSLKDKKIAVLGLAFKAETDDMRESPAITIINELLKKGAKIRAHDPQALKNAEKIFGDKIEYLEDMYEALEGADGVIIITEWNEYRGLDLEKVARLVKEKVILDTRNVLDIRKAKEYGFRYEGVGRK